jgi:hypothetical protein
MAGRPGTQASSHFVSLHVIKEVSKKVETTGREIVWVSENHLPQPLSCLVSGGGVLPPVLYSHGKDFNPDSGSFRTSISLMLATLSCRSRDNQPCCSGEGDLESKGYLN